MIHDALFLQLHLITLLLFQWVECDKCKKWQHQICVLFNARTNKERSEYICPECCIAEIERGERVPRPANSVLGAKDLPRTMLSDFVEERLSWKLQLERVERSKASGKRLEEVNGRYVKVNNDALCIRNGFHKILSTFTADSYC